MTRLGNRISVQHGGSTCDRVGLEVTILCFVRHNQSKYASILLLSCFRSLQDAFPLYIFVLLFIYNLFCYLIMSICDSSAVSNEKQAREQREKETAVSSSQPLVAPLPPNGGTIAWLFVFAAFLLFFVTWGPSAGVGAFQEYYQRSLLSHYSPSAISWIGTVNATFLISTGVLAGPLFDRGYVRHLMVLGSFMVVFGQMMLSLSTEYYQILLSQGFCVGIGAGLIYVPAIAMVNVKFTTRRAIAMGLVTSGASLGMFHAGPQNTINVLICDT